MTFGDPVVWLALWVAVLSLVSFVQFGRDKAQARNGGWRIAEATLLTVALFGGWPGAKIGQRVFRHKTRKQPFAGLLNVAMGVNLIGVCALLYPPSRRALLDLIASGVG